LFFSLPLQDIRPDTEIFTQNDHIHGASKTLWLRPFEAQCQDGDNGWLDIISDNGVHPRRQPQYFLSAR
jgi:hypothetical protein